MKKIYRDLTGEKFGRLMVLKRSKDKITPKGVHYKMWDCLCDCGTRKDILENSLIRGKTKSCGCLSVELSKRLKPNEYDLEKCDYGIGYLYNGKQFIFDKEDFEIIKNHRWTWDGRYVSTSIDGKKNYIHRFLTGVKGYKNKVDHINHNTCDNRKCNLRIVTNSENLQNSKVRRNNKTGITGVSFNEGKGNWKAIICYKNQNINIGTFATKEEARLARLKAEDDYFGKYSYRESMNKSEDFKIC